MLYKNKLSVLKSIRIKKVSLTRKISTLILAYSDWDQRYGAFLSSSRGDCDGLHDVDEYGLQYGRVHGG